MQMPKQKKITLAGGLQALERRRDDAISRVVAGFVPPLLTAPCPAPPFHPAQ